MNNISGDSPCPACKSVGKDSTGNHLIHFKDGTKHCNKCGLLLNMHGAIVRGGEYNYGGAVLPAAKAQPPWEKENSKSYIWMTKDTPEDYSSHEDRGISRDTREKYGVVSSVSETDGSLVAHFYPVYVEGVQSTYKKRTLPKGFALLDVMKGKEADLFGQHLFPKGSCRKLLITEGEEDAMAAYDMIQAKRYGHAVVSLPDGASSRAFLKNIEYIQSFSEVILCLDNDKVGKELVDELSSILPSIKTMGIIKKDACEMLQEGFQIAFNNAFMGASRYVPQTIISASEVKLEASKPILMGLDYPFPSLTKATYGLRTPQVIGIGAGPGGGKSTFIQAIEECLIYRHKQKIAILSLEEQPKYSLRKLAGGVMKKPVHLPDCIYNQSELDDVLNDLSDKVFFCKHHKDFGFTSIEKTVRYLALGEGVRYFFIDPMSALVAHLDSGDANTYLNGAMLSLETMSNDLDITFFHVNHLNSPIGTKDHGEGAKVRAGQFSGSRAMWKFSTDLFGLERDQLAETEEERNTINLVGLKNRMSGDTFQIKLKYNKTTGCLEELSSLF